MKLRSHTYKTIQVSHTAIKTIPHTHTHTHTHTYTHSHTHTHAHAHAHTHTHTHRVIMFCFFGYISSLLKVKYATPGV